MNDRNYWIVDVEADGFLDTVTKIWCIVGRNVDTGEVVTFLRPDENPEPYTHWQQNVKLFIFHNGIKFDIPLLTKFGLRGIITLGNTLDTLVLSRLIHQARPGGHSLEAWGLRFGAPKGSVKDFSVYTPEMLEYCIQDTLINKLLYYYLEPYIDTFKEPYDIEAFIEWQLYWQIHLNGFKIDIVKLHELYSSLSKTVSELTAEMHAAFPPRPKLIREITPTLTKHGTLHAKDFRWLSSGTTEAVDLSPYSEGGSFSLFTWEVFNPGSPQQVVRILNEAGWKPVNKTDGHKDLEKEGPPKNPQERQAYYERLAYFRTYGWSIDEDNLATVPKSAPEAVHIFVRWRMLQSRVSKIEEWLEALNGGDTIHGTITGLGTVTHRCNHTDPNVGNIPSVAPKYDTKGPIYPEASAIGKQLRSLWVSRPKRVLIGTDADSIQLRVLACYMRDEAFKTALVSGKKEDGTDPHSLNKQALGPVCGTRDVAKTFIYAWLLGAGVSKVATILACSKSDAREAIERFIQSYPGLKRLRDKTIPEDARQGFYTGFDGRKVIPKGADFDQKVYYMLSGYLQNGEQVIMKHATRRWMLRADEEGIPYWWVNYVHDEWQTETEDDGGLERNDKGVWVACSGSYPARLGYLQRDAIRAVGEQFGLFCPLAGESKYGYNWLETH
mgnify:CR=1 FL=1